MLVDGEIHLDPLRIHEAVEAARSLAPSLYARADAAMQQQSTSGLQAKGLASWLSSVGTAVIGPDQAVKVSSDNMEH